MNQRLAGLQAKELEEIYLREIQILKLKLLSRAFKKDILKQEDKVLALALAIHAKQYGELVTPDAFT